MRSLRFLSLFLLPAALVVVGCSEQNSPTALDEAGSIGSVPGGTANAANPVVLRASGSGHAQATLTVGWRTFSFTATQRADATVNGHAQYNNRGEGIIQHGKAVCMRDLGAATGEPLLDGMIVLGFEGTQRIGPDPLPNPLGLPPPDLDGVYGFFIVVRDNGEGAAAAPDQITGSLLTTLPTVMGVCAGALDNLPPAVVLSFFTDIQAGNIEVG